MKKINVLSVFGTRPEAIKMAPLVLELQKRPEIESRVCLTAQHREMLDSVMECFGLQADYDLNIMHQGQTLTDITSRVLNGLGAILAESKPDLILVHGDTSTTFAGALSAFYHQVKVGHVEAGLRTYDLYSPYPEEFNRQAVGIVARYHFAPTENARQNLLREGKDPSHIFVTGNTAIDALRTTVTEHYTQENLEWAAGSRLILLTAHRRENLGQPMHEMFRAIRRIMDEYADVKLIYPIHMNPQVRRIASEELTGCDRIRLIEPLDVLDFHNFMAASYLILTDSGGIQEEAPSLGKPVLVMRNTTERAPGGHRRRYAEAGGDGGGAYLSEYQAALGRSGGLQADEPGVQPLRRWLCQRPHCGYTQKGTAVNGHKPSVLERNSYEQLYQ